MMSRSFVFIPQGQELTEVQKILLRGAGLEDHELVEVASDERPGEIVVKKIEEILDNNGTGIICASLPILLAKLSYWAGTFSALGLTVKLYVITEERLTALHKLF